MPILDKELKIFNDNKRNKIFNDCFNNTYDTTLKTLDNGDLFVITGDIPAMWLRDSSAQVMHYLHFAKEQKVQELIKGILNTQFKQIIEDPYANAFMENKQCKSMWSEYLETDYVNKLVWERKFELDSLCYPFFLAIKFYEKTNDRIIFSDNFFKAFDTVIETISKEQHHSQKSSYFFKLKTPWEEKPQIAGINCNPEEEKGLIWSGFRPSDDLCKYNYHIPDNMFLVSILNKLEKIFRLDLEDENRANICSNFVNILVPLIEKYGITEVDGFGKIYVSETNCLGKWHADDDANIPSLLSIPYLEYPFIDIEIYKNTRKYILSKNNKYFYEGKILKGIGSPHTPANMVWTLALSMQGLTSDNQMEKDECLNMLFKTAVDNELMHEGVDVDDTKKFTRPWFAWANSLFADFVLKNYQK